MRPLKFIHNGPTTNIQDQPEYDLGKKADWKCIDWTPDFPLLGMTPKRRNGGGTGNQNAIRGGMGSLNGQYKQPIESFELPDLPWVTKQSVKTQKKKSHTFTVIRVTVTKGHIKRRATGRLALR
eukprot:scaffold1466_cov159-Amphora_coffeaeformis.AAC.2